MHRDILGCLDAEPDLPPVHSQNDHLDVVADLEYLSDAASQNSIELSL